MRPRGRPPAAAAQSEDAGHLLLARRCDIAVVIPSEQTPAPDDARFAQWPVLDEPQDLLVPAGHPLAARGAVGLADAGRLPRVRRTYQKVACHTGRFLAAAARHRSDVR
ncbi:LysR substrate-binding domain-containing protein [Actinomadura sp. NPDC048032]|uniref:LysR substrate-binding domain-containing protein n=1 Tax=Actinomadura sp. NPDC048032 TaxID=3155747 RepID=UPI0033E024A5